ncbi:MAG: alpha/beta hydrolase [Bacteroidota bacterium]|nr:alpha/beta hydrolase [Bacteroidota bacterium]
MKKSIGFILIASCLAVFSLNPSRKYAALPESLGLKYSRSFIGTPDAMQLNTWIFRTAEDSFKKNITIIIAGGDAGNMSSQLLLAEGLQKKGFDVVTFDYRGFGESSNFKIDSSYLYYSEFVTDLVSVMRKTKSIFPDNKTAILARSMGSIITAIAFKDERSDYVIGDGFVKSLTDMKKRLEDYKKTSIKLPKDSMRFSNAISGINAKMLIFAGQQDWLTTVDDAKKITEKNYNRKLVIHPLGHLETAKAFTNETYADGMINEMISFFTGYKN